MRLREDDEVTASNVLSDENRYIYIVRSFPFQRIKQTDILVNNRNTMGTLIARKVKVIHTILNILVLETLMMRLHFIKTIYL